MKAAPGSTSGIPILTVSVGAVSEGGLREENQDCMSGFTSPFGAAYLVADGMGGHRGGAEASRIVVDAVSRHLQAASPSSPIADALTLALRLANAEVLEKGNAGNPDFAGMGSTVALALLSSSQGGGMELTTAHVGDSRIYLERRGSLTQLTRDHTHIQRLIDNRELDEEAARDHPDASVLTRAMGHTTDLEVDMNGPFALESGDGILLCSDGLSGFVGSDAIRQAIEHSLDPAECARRLVELALAAGSNDNVTVQFLRLAAAAPVARGRSRETAPEELPAPKLPAKRRGLLLSLLIAFLVVSAVAAGLWLYRSRLSAAPPAPIAKKEMTQQERAKNLEQAAARCEGEAGKSREQARRDQTGPHLSARGAGALLPQIENLEKELARIQSAAHKIEEDAKGYEGDAARLETHAGGRASPTRPQEAAQLTKWIGTGENDLEKQEAEMQDARNQLSGLESKLAAPE